MEYNINEIRARVISLRVLHEKTIEEFAAKLKLSTEEYIQFENGLKDVSLEAVVSLLNELGYIIKIEQVVEGISNVE